MEHFEERHVVNLRPQPVPGQPYLHGQTSPTNSNFDLDLPHPAHIPQSRPERPKPQREPQRQTYPAPRDTPVVMQPHNTQYPGYPDIHHPYSKPPLASNVGVDRHPQQLRQQALFEPNIMGIDSYLAFSSPSACPGQTQAPNHPLPAQAATSLYASTSSSRTSMPQTGTTHSRPVSSLLLSKPFRCPKPNCNKSYRYANGLKYHMTHGSCNSAPPKDSEALQALLYEKGVLINGDDRSGRQITEGELLELEREAERRRRPFACGVGDCQRRYMNMNGLSTSLSSEILFLFGADMMV